jgi:hypothetical protein
VLRIFSRRVRRLAIFLVVPLSWRKLRRCWDRWLLVARPEIVFLKNRSRLPIHRLPLFLCTAAALTTLVQHVFFLRPG